MEEKISLPTKTKIVAWFLIVIGTIGILGLFISLFGLISMILIKFIGFPPSKTPLLSEIPKVFLLGILITMFNFLPGIFLLKRKKWSWWLVIILISSSLLYSLMKFSSFGILINSFLLALLLLDRKNFLKVAK